MGTAAEWDRPPRIAILGAGVAGLCMAMQLRRAGIEGFTIFEKADDLGGTWLHNTYPGSGCDVPSHLYCFSFEPNPSWSRRFAEQDEILQYLRACADKYDLLGSIRFGTEITEMHHDGTAWQLMTARGARHEFDLVVCATGQLNRPFVPPIPGREAFSGTQFHAARWQHDHDLTGRDVAVIGNGASAVQFVPHVVNKARRMTLFQRSAHWLVKKPDRAYYRPEKWAFHNVPLAAKLHRLHIYWALEGRFGGFREGTLVHRAMGWIAARELDQVKDPELRGKLTPDYPIGCKRILISNDYYQALQQRNVTVVNRPIERFTTEGVVADGTLYPADTVIFGTGFESTRFLAPIRIVGTEGWALEDVWRDGAEAYLGMSVAGFPNFFILYGPNTNLGHSSIIFMIECQTRYVVQCLEAMRHARARRMEVTRLAVERYNEDLQAALGDTVWGAGCDNWYRHESGKITNNWASYTTSYWWRTRRPDLSAFLLR